MCYKYLWDNLVADDFPSEKFFTYFGLNPQNNLCEDLKVIGADPGFSASVSTGYGVAYIVLFLTVMVFSFIS